MHHQLPTIAPMRAGKATTNADDRAKAAPRPRAWYPLTSIVAALWLVVSYVDFVSFTGDMKTNGTYGCEMAYMWPNYTHITWDGSERERYSVHLYREQNTDPQSPVGTPVVFLPGNAGSFKQVRSIASSASRLFHGHDGTSWPHSLDFFSYDYNEDFSALHAPTLEDQSAFVAATIPRILEQYPADRRPEKVILFGHSMGGIVARLAALQMDNSSIEAIVTMSTPHAIPPVAFEHKIDALYERINTASYAAPAPLLISICGGVADNQILSESCALDIPAEDGFAVFSTAMPGAWTGVEHQAMVWCDQVRWRVARALLDMTAKPREQRLAAARKWLVAGETRGKEIAGAESTEVEVVATNMTFIVRIPDTTDAILADIPVRVRHCAGVKCTEPKWTAHAIPRPANPNDPFPFPGEGIKVKETAVVVDVLDLPSHGKLKLEAPHGSEVVSGSFESFAVGSSWRAAGSSPAHLALTFDRPVSSLLAWRLATTTGTCSGPPPVIQHESSPTPGDVVPVESRFYPAANRMTLHSHISGAPFHHTQSSHGVRVHIYQQPGCTVQTASLSLDVGATLAKGMLRFRIAAVTWCAGWVGVLLFRQLGEYRASGTVPPLQVVVESSMRQNVAIVGSTLLGAPILQSVLGLGWRKEQFFLGSTELIHLPFSILIAFWALGLVVVVQRLQAGMIAIAARFGGKSDADHRPSPPTHSRWTMVSRVLPSAALLLLVKTFIPWRMAFVVLYIIQFANVVRSAQKEQPRRHLLASVFLLMTFLLPLTLPAIAVWARNLWNNHGHPFAADHAVLPLVPVLLVVQLGGLGGGVARNKMMINAAQGAAAALAVTSVLISARRAYFLIGAADVLFLALAGMVAEGM